MFKEMIVDNLLAIVAAYRKETGKSLTTVSKDFYGRGDFFAKLKKGEHTISIERIDKMLEDFRAKWPEGAQWPTTRPIFMTKTPVK